MGESGEGHRRARRVSRISFQPLLNRKTASALGLAIPQEMLLRAELVIDQLRSAASARVLIAYSGLMPTSLTTFAHLTDSERI